MMYTEKWTWTFNYLSKEKGSPQMDTDNFPHATW